LTGRYQHLVVYSVKWFRLFHVYRTGTNNTFATDGVDSDFTWSQHSTVAGQS